MSNIPLCVEHAMWLSDNGSYRGLRGGSFNNNDNNLHASNRNNNNPTNENNNIGFRVSEAPETPSVPLPFTGTAKTQE